MDLEAWADAQHSHEDDGGPGLPSLTRDPDRLRQLLGVGVVVVVAGLLVSGWVRPVTWLAWLAVGLAGLLFSLADRQPVRWLLDRLGGIAASALVMALLLGTGGADSVFQDVYGIILVFGGVAYGWRRLAIDVTAVTVFGLVPGVLEAAGRGFYVDFLADLGVWVGMALVALSLETVARREAARSRRMLEIIDQLPDTVGVVDPGSLRLRYVNRRGRTLVGEEGIIGRPMTSVTTATTESRLRDLVQRLEDGADEIQLEHVSHRTDPPRTYETVARLVTAEGQGEQQLVLLARDVTAQRHDQRRARQLAGMVDAADLAMIGTCERGWVRSWNRAAERLYGVPADVAVGSHLSTVVEASPDDPVQGRAPFDTNDRHIRYTSPHRHADGSIFAAEVTAWPVGTDSENGDAAPGVAVLVRDVSAARRAARGLLRREQRFRTFAEQARGIVYSVRIRPSFELTYISPRVQELLGDTPEELIEDPSPLFARIHPDDGHPFELPERWEEGVHLYRVRRTDGTWMWLEDHHAPEYDGDGRIVGSQGILFDVSARKELEEARRQTLEQERAVARELERTTRAQQTFLRSISHELRTPLTAVRGFTQTLRDHLGHLDAATTEHLLRRLGANVERLDEQLQDLLDLDMGRQAPDGRAWGSVNLRTVALAAVAAVDASTHEVRVTADEVAVQGDRVKLARAVTALVRNAVVHTPAGTTVTISTECVGDETRLHVTDDGPGIDEEIAETLFEPFVQGQAAATAAQPGAGVGLAVVREVARLHQGRVEQWPRVPRGAHFVLVLPASGAAATAQDADDSDVR